MCKKIQGQNEEHVVDQKKKQEHVGRNENLSKKKKKAPIEDGGTYINQSNYK